MAVFTREHKAIRVGMLISGEHRSPFGEGIFQYLTLLVKGASPGALQFNLVLSQNSVEAFEVWRDHLPPELQADVVVIGAPDRVSRNFHSIEIDLEVGDWIRAFEKGVDVWFTLQPHYAILTAANKPVATIFADWVFSEYFTMFPPEINIEPQYEATKKMASVVSRFICFSEHVKKNHICKVFGISEERVVVLPHARFDYADVTGCSFTSKKAAADRIRDYLADEALTPIEDRPNRDIWQRRLLGNILKGFPFEEVDYALVSTRARPHKNTGIVLRAALEMRRTYANTKIIVTAPISWTAPQDAFSKEITDSGLQWDVIALAQLPSEVHAAVYRCAAVTVHPSPFEGGFPFTAFESLSMGTPILIADGAVAREFLPIEDREHFLFNPTSPSQLAARIGETIRDRDKVLSRQLQAIEKFPRSLRQNTNELIALFEQLIMAPPLGVARVDAGEISFNSEDQSDLTAEGWWPKEDWGRWSSSGRSTLRFWNAPGSAAHAIELHLSVPPYEGAEFMGWITINDDPASRITISDSGNKHSLMVTINGLPEGLVTVAINTRKLSRPSDMGSADGRAMGFGLGQVRFLTGGPGGGAH
ncbi:glycosyltransferase [Caulobacter sp. S45]|uniref:glycosyltransferase n=1 Tax=Caulobacter sp. S45 TaxID=1641861 RepID=UPI00131B024B|nr:glycosyltransferase [Caulobacter sp. S45]